MFLIDKRIAESINISSKSSPDPIVRQCISLYGAQSAIHFCLVEKSRPTYPRMFQDLMSSQPPYLLLCQIVDQVVSTIMPTCYGTQKINFRMGEGKCTGPTRCHDAVIVELPGCVGRFAAGTVAETNYYNVRRSYRTCSNYRVSYRCLGSGSIINYQKCES